jgi:hypothetical protein
VLQHGMDNRNRCYAHAVPLFIYQKGVGHDSDKRGLAPIQEPIAKASPRARLLQKKLKCRLK